MLCLELDLANLVEIVEWQLCMLELMRLLMLVGFWLMISSLLLLCSVFLSTTETVKVAASFDVTRRAFSRLPTVKWLVLLSVFDNILEVFRRVYWGLTLR